MCCVLQSLRHSPGVTRRNTKIKRDDRYIIIGIDFGVIWAADLKNAIRFYVRRPTRKTKFTHCLPSHQNLK